ncbi:N-acetyltransferase [Leptospira vanthielii]|uniref:N-acetyltransferase n=1 Tax=Leptospira vanthielii TaxID=293085 RepID=A0ABY2NJI7_9LEPT|nr:N-acetyltransferase [Leptospira vanthielii]TGM45981.1 N-acetyltransferase [Leptospira vanthielii]
MTIEEIKKLIAAGKIKPLGNELKNGKIESKNKKHQYKIFHGWDIARASKTDNEWGRFNLELLDSIMNKGYNKESLEKVLQGVQLHDYHWSWLAKHQETTSDRYNWFFLDVNGLTEAICLTFHPKQSVFDSSEIFYIEYIAVAPWNRLNPYQERKFSGLGSVLVQSVCEYFIEKHKYNFRFSLHSVKAAETFYKKIGMTKFPEHDKENLYYYEMTNPKEYIIKEENV